MLFQNEEDTISAEVLAQQCAHMRDYQYAAAFALEVCSRHHVCSSGDVLQVGVQ